MKQLSKAIARIAPSATIAMTSKAAEMRAQGKDILSLSAGEPDFDTPAHICDAAKSAIEAGKTRYTPADGISELREAIQSKLMRENGLEYGLDEIIVGGGAKQIIFDAFMATINPGDEVIIPVPAWVSYPDIASFSGGKPVLLPCRAEEGYRLGADGLHAAITEKTKWLVLNSPCNPTGAVYSHQHLCALGEILQKYPDILILSDEIYEHLTYPPAEFTSFPSSVPELKERCLIINGVSKAYAMTGWRIGYGAGPKPLIAAMRKLQSQSVSCVSAPSQWAAKAALDGAQTDRISWLGQFRSRRDLVMSELSKIRGFKPFAPEGAFYVFVEIQEWLGAKTARGSVIEDDHAFVEALLEEEGVALVSGSAFHGPAAFRLSFAADEKTLLEACARIARFVAGLTASGAGNA